MKTYELDHYKKSRIWFEPNKALFFERYDQIYSYEFTSSRSNLKNNKTIILELILPRGGRIIHGILGVEYMFKDTGKISIEVPIIKDKTSKFSCSLLKYEDVYVGLPDEYHNAVYHGVERAYKENKLFLTGKLSFRYAAYGDVSSCAWIFNILSYSLINLIFLPSQDIDSQLIEKIIKEEQINNYH